MLVTVVENLKTFARVSHFCEGVCGGGAYALSSLFGESSIGGCSCVQEVEKVVPKSESGRKGKQRKVMELQYVYEPEMKGLYVSVGGASLFALSMFIVHSLSNLQPL